MVRRLGFAGKCESPSGKSFGVIAQSYFLLGPGLPDLPRCKQASVSIATSCSCHHDHHHPTPPPP